MKDKLIFCVVWSLCVVYLIVAKLFTIVGDVMLWLLEKVVTAFGGMERS